MNAEEHSTMTQMLNDISGSIIAILIVLVPLLIIL